MISEFSAFENLNVEGTEHLVMKFQIINNKMKKKSYEILDHRNPDFDNSFLEFQRQMVDLEVML